MESLLSEQFKLGANIGRPYSAAADGQPNAAESIRDSRDNSGGVITTRRPVPMLPSTTKPNQTSSISITNIIGRGSELTKQKDQHDISRTVSQDTADTAAMSVLSELTGATNTTDTTLDAAIVASKERGGVLELSTIEENDGTSTGLDQTPGAKSHDAVAGSSATDLNKNIDIKMAGTNQQTRGTFPDFVTSMPKTWSGSSLSFIKFLLFVKESDESFIPEMDRMLADYDMLINSLQTENADLKEKLRTELATLKRRIHDKKKLVNKLTKKLTECQGYITELTDELERLCREKGIAPGRDLTSSRPDEVTIATATSEITMEQSIQVGHHSSIEATLSRMLAEERSKADTLTDLNKSITDDLNDTKKEVDELERKLAQSEKCRTGLEKTLEGNWTKVEALIDENKTLQEDLAGVVIELSDAQEEFAEREDQLIRMIEAGGENVAEDDMSVEDEDRQQNVHDLEANVAILQEELLVSKGVLEAVKSREKESMQRAGELLIRNEILRTKNEAMEGLQRDEVNSMKAELSKVREENLIISKRLQHSDAMINFAREIISSTGGNTAVLGASSAIEKDRRIAELERQVSFLQRDQDYKSHRAATCLRDTLVYLYDYAAGSTKQDPSSLINSVLETTKMFVQQPSAAADGSLPSS